MSIDVLKDKIKDKDYGGLYFFYGEEEYTKDRYVDMLRKCVSGCLLPEFNHVILDAASTTSDDLEDALYSPPSMNDYKMIEVRGLDLATAKKATLESYKKCFDDVPEGCVLLFCFRAGELTEDMLSPKKAGKSDTVSPAAAFIDDLSSKALTVNFEKETGDKLYAWIRKHFVSRKVEIDNNAVYTLVDMCGNDMYVLLGEIEKLAMLYDGSAPISRSDVTQVCCSNETFRIYELSNAVMKGDLYTAKKVFDNLRLNRTEANTMLSQLSRAFSDALLITAGVADGKSNGEIASALKIPPNRVAAIAAGCRGKSYQFLARAVVVFDEADRRLKSSREDAYLVVETAICKACVYGK